MKPNCLLACLAGLFLCCPVQAAEEFKVGVTRADVSPEHPVRLSGYGGRRTESEGVAQRLWVKALAIQARNEAPAVLLTVDNVGVPGWIREELVKRLAKKANRFDPDRFAICSSHTHSAPCLSGVLSNLFSQDIATNEWDNIGRYTQKLIDEMEAAALAALKDLRPGKLWWGQGRASFAKNRRTSGGPVDHALPVLKVTDAKGKLRAVLANYACHCTTLEGNFNQVHGDWAGYAQEYIERDHPGAVALISIGCGADANPQPRAKLEHANQHGEEIAAEVKEMLEQHLSPLETKPIFSTRRIELPFGELPTRAQWEERAKQSGIVGYHAKKNLARLDRGEALPTKLPYLLQTWTFGNDLAMVFLPGEVVVDYALRLKRELDEKRVWVHAYANDVPCYIPSRRILKEGGYEAESSLWYYDRPARLAPETEDLIIKTVHDLMPNSFNAKEAGHPKPLSPAQALKTLRTKPGLTIDLAAAEPLVESPVAIDWDAKGRLWVVEMFDYPMGIDGNWKPGGRVKMLEDRNRDGEFDHATTFLDGLPFPTGLMVTPRGVLVCAAPNILFAQDTNGDGKADIVRTNYTGFAIHNYQARVNGFAWGLDGWIHGSSGLFGGKITNLVTGKELDLSGRDFRIHPDTWEIQPVAGITQQGRIRDDWGNWFGNDNSTLLWHFPLPDHYARRNPHVTYPSPRINVATRNDPNKLFPLSRTLERFNDPQMANRTTSACGPEIYRDTFLGDEFYGDAFICEPVHNLVVRLELDPQGVTFAAHRPKDEQNREFLASTDNWFRPVQVRTGPDGALWVVDMYRFVVEHPRWIAPERLKQLDVRAGADKGRIYRIYPKSKRPQFPALSLDSSNGPTRDMAQSRVGKDDVKRVARIFQTTSNPAVRVQSLATLAQLGEVPREIMDRALGDSHPGVRAQAVRVAREAPGLATDPDPGVRFQLALSLGDLKSPAASRALAELASQSSDAWMDAAILSSARFHLQPLIAQGADRLFMRLVESAIGFGEREEANRALAAHIEKSGGKISPGLASSFLDVLEKQKAGSLPSPAVQAAIQKEIASARRIVPARGSDAAKYVSLLGREKSAMDEDIKLLGSLLTDQNEVSSAALKRLGSIDDLRVPAYLVAQWRTIAPALRPRTLSLLTSREPWVEQLFAALKDQRISPAEISLEQRQRLLKHDNDSIRERAEKLLPETAKRTEVLARYGNLRAVSANASRGAALFDQNCASCHLHRGRGNAVGPALAEFAGKSADDFALAIFDPNAAIDPKYVTFNVETRDGRSFTGVVKDETASGFALLQGGGVRETILRAEVADMLASPLSLMPEGLEQALSPQDAADLIAWIKQSAPAPFGQATAEQQAKARADFLARSSTSFQVLSGSEALPYPSWLGKLSMPYCRQSDGRSKLAWQCAAPNASGTFTFPVAMGLVSQPSGAFTLKVNGKPVLDFNVALADEVWSSSDGQVRMTYTVMERNSEDSNGILEIALREPVKPAAFEVTGSAAQSQRWFGLYVMPQQNASRP